MDDVYDLFKRGTALLESGDFNSATVPLEKARDLEPEKTSIREALGRAYFRSGQFEPARAEFEVLLAEVVGGGLVRLFIDHPDGVSLDLCERVTGHLDSVRKDYALEVSSPGPRRPLT